MTTPKILVLDRSELLADQIRGAVAEMSPLPQVVNCSRLGAAGEVLEADGPFDVLVAGPSLGTRSGLARLRLIRENLPTMSLVLAFSRRPDASLRDIVSTGAIDLLQLPLEDKELSEAIQRGIELAESAPAVVGREHRGRTGGGQRPAPAAPASSTRSPRPRVGAARPSSPRTSPTS